MKNIKVRMSDMPNMYFDLETKKFYLTATVTVDGKEKHIILIGK